MALGPRPLCSTCGERLLGRPRIRDGKPFCWRCDPDPPKRQRERRSRPKSATVAPKKLTRSVMALEPLTGEDREMLAERPRTRAECVGAERPCPWVSCRHHLYLDINPQTGSIKINFPDLEPWELTHSCALDVAERGMITLEECGEILNVTRERVRQLETRSLFQLKRALRDPR